MIAPPVVRPPICVGCALYDGERCEAFGGVPPEPILWSEADHRQPFQGDGGRRFTPVAPWASRYAASTFEQEPDDTPSGPVQPLAEFAYSPGQSRDTKGRFGTGGVTSTGQLEEANDMGDFNETGQKAILARAASTADAIEKAGHGTFPRTVEQMAAGLDDTWSRATPDQRERGMRWYEDAHNEVSASASTNGLSADQGFAITAALSPGRKWEGNLAIAKRIMEVHGKDEPFTPDPKGVAKLYKEIALPPSKDGTYRPSELTGTQLAVVHPRLQGVSGSRNQSVQFETAFQVARGGSIDGLLGGTKVRNFYNNLRDPSDTSSVTVDTWQVRAQTSPWASMVPKGAVPKGGVKEWTPVNNTGKKGDKAQSITWATGSPGSVDGGVGDGVGMYPMFASAIKVAARKHGVDPNQMQAVTWTVYREEHPE